MKRLLEQVRSLLRGGSPPDRFDLQRQMRRDDPAFNHVKRVQGEFIDALTAKGILDGEAIRRERQFWTRTGKHDDA